MRNVLWILFKDEIIYKGVVWNMVHCILHFVGSKTEDGAAAT